MIRQPPRSTLSSSSAASDVYKRQTSIRVCHGHIDVLTAIASESDCMIDGLDSVRCCPSALGAVSGGGAGEEHHPLGSLSLSLIHISEPTRLLSISYAVFCLKKKKKRQQRGDKRNEELQLKKENKKKKKERKKQKKIRT
eukprot:TRINITY_DN20657_c0_g1_i1.p1 TRINITY_DN20657_c0_g1~~TRINITY_DN20657_c0_g1_i1.p1  ORF type:complete len:140 (+),score=27.80 TRINITY_DN20657_c0_g1_i1:111-530(+)